MPTREELKRAVCDAIDGARDEIIRIGEDIYRHPEPGFKEFRTAGIVADHFASWGIPFQTGLAITGVRGEIRGGADGPTVAVLGELDSLVIPDHIAADPRTGAAHACGHHAQVANMLGVGLGLIRSGVYRYLAGRVVLFGVPAEEYIEIQERLELRRLGKVEFLGGKPELIRLGAFDDIDMAMLTHSSTDTSFRLGVTAGSNGMVAKSVRFIGRASHAGAAPHRGVNALNAAMLALSAIHANRETFQEKDTVRVHPIITKGGDVVNIVPADVRMETFVRALNLEALEDANQKVDRCLRAGALAVGAKVVIETMPGYLPLEQNPDLVRIFKANAVQLVGEEGYRDLPPTQASTDAGDLSHILPVLHPSASGSVGQIHGADFRVGDPELAYVIPAKAMAMTVVDLLADGAVLARQVKANSRPKLTKRQYLESMRRLFSTQEYSE
ncbi:MAG: amidohydrolase [Chloroflexota bacterium]